MARRTQQESIANRGFQIALPCYVKGRAIQASGQMFTRGQVFPWKELGMTPERVANMFPRLLRHNAADLAKIGDDIPLSDVRQEPAVIPEKTAEELLQEKAVEAMSLHELRIVGKAYGVPNKRSIKDQLEAVQDAMEATGVDV